MNNAIVRDATPRLLDGAGRNGSSAGHEALTFRSEALRGVYAPVLEPLERVQARLEHLSGASDATIDALSDYGRNLGMAFQIVDDIVDFHGTVDENGRPKGSDLAQGVMTLPAIIAVERYPEDNPIDTLFRNGNGHSGSGRTLDEVSLRRALELVRSSSVIDEAYELATHYCDRALDSLTALDSNRSRESLERLAAHLIDAG